MNAPPMVFTWDGIVMHPRHPRLADKHFVVGMDYIMVEEEPRSGPSHRQFFACVNEAWKNVPEDMAERWPTAEHMRKWALIQTGYCDETTVVCASRAEALRWVAIARGLDDFCIAVPRDSVVTIYRAKSQSMRAMGKRDFQASKDAVLGKLAEVIGVEPQVLSRQTEAA